MPKTKDAFALPRLITIVFSIDHINIENIDNEKNKLLIWANHQKNKIFEFEEETFSRQKKVSRHVLRLEKYRATLLDSVQDETDYIKAQKNFVRVQKLIKEYRRLHSFCGKLLNITNQYYVDCEKNSRRYVLSIFARRLKQARKKAGLTQKELAKKIGTRLSNINAYEQARNEPGISFLKILSTVLDTPADWFLSDDQDDHN